MNHIDIVQADLSMLSALVDLSAQLGYEMAPELMSVQLQKIRSREDQLLVTAQVDGEVKGWAQFYIVELIYSTSYVEVGGIVVDQTCRQQGLGHALLLEGER